MTRDTALKIKHGVGGKAFPNDYDWQCRTCLKWCRAFEYVCQYCLHDQDIKLVEENRVLRKALEGCLRIAQAHLEDVSDQNPGYPDRDAAVMEVQRIEAALARGEVGVK